MLRSALRRAEARFGDGFLNSVLVLTIRVSPSGQSSLVHEVLGKIRVNPTDARRTDYKDCESMITGFLKNLWDDLTGKLGYSNEQSTEILDGAVASYLDERFSVSNRRMLGFR